MRIGLGYFLTSYGGDTDECEADVGDKLTELRLKRPTIM